MFQYLKMSSFVILFVVGVTLNLQADACVSQDTYIIAKNIKDGIGDEMRDLSNFITNLKVNYIQELIDIKLNATFQDVSLILNYGRRIGDKFLEATENRAHNCSQFPIAYVTIMSSNYSMKYKACVKNQFDYLRPVEDDIQAFLAERTSCPLDYDPLTASLCSIPEPEDVEICSGVVDNLNPENWRPYECDFGRYNAEKERLKADAERLVSIGISNAVDCISEFADEFETHLKTEVDIVEECLDNIV